MPRTKASLAITQLAPIVWLGGPNLKVAAGNSPSTHAQPMLKCLSGQSRFRRGMVLQVHPESAGLLFCAQPVLTLCLMRAAAMLHMRMSVGNCASIGLAHACNHALILQCYHI